MACYSMTYKREELTEIILAMHVGRQGHANDLRDLAVVASLAGHNTNEILTEVLDHVDTICGFAP